MVGTDDTQRTTDNERQTTPRVWHKLLTGELKIIYYDMFMVVTLCLCLAGACVTSVILELPWTIMPCKDRGSSVIGLVCPFIWFSFCQDDQYLVLSIHICQLL